MYELKNCIAIHDIVEIDFNHYMRFLNACFQWQMPPEKLSCTPVCTISVQLYIKGGLVHFKFARYLCT